MKYKKGITLIELIVALGIFAMVLGVGFMIFLFGNRTYTYGTNQYDIQANLRLSEEYIKTQLKYASYIKVMDGTAPAQASLDSFENYIYYDSSTKSMVHLNRFFIKRFNLSPSRKPEDITGIEFKSLSPYTSLYYKLYAKYNRQEYEIENTADLLNIHLSKTDTGTPLGIVDGTPSGTEITGTMIRYRTPSDYMASLLKPTAVFDKIELDKNGSGKDEITFHCEYDNGLSTTRLEVNTAKVIYESVGTTGTTIEKQLDGSGKFTVLKFSCTNASPPIRVLVEVTFTNAEFVSDTYIYILEYKDAGEGWTIR